MYIFGAGSEISKKVLAPWDEAMLSNQICLKKVTLQYFKEVMGYDFFCYIYDQVNKIRQEI